MKTLVSIAAFLLSALPVLADAQSPLPPVPPAVNYEVWGYHWEGQRYVKQPKYTFSTADLNKAADYVTHINRFAGWTATSNIPFACVASPYSLRSAISQQQPSAVPPWPTFTVWAFRLTDGQWVKDEKYCWTTTDPVKGAEYAKKVNAVSGWSATGNCPPAAESRPQQYVFGSTVPGGRFYIDVQSLIRDARNGSLRGAAVPGGSGSGGKSTWNTPAEYTPPYDNTNDIQKMINTQNMLNTQDMINTQNMVNSMQDMVNTQNMVNAMQANP